MELRRATYRAAIRMAMSLSAVSVALALLIDSTTGVSQTTLVLAVIVVGFVSSWVSTERVARANALRTRAITQPSGHRVTVLPAPHRIA
ncbi:MAG TPA: hypothetical protein VMM60_02095 [Ilumatobacter sp.]|nr:hypothetical protein [Ilumatobacter sp.]